jgi:DNA-binding NarL/FixJ family response regulator
MARDSTGPDCALAAKRSTSGFRASAPASTPPARLQAGKTRVLLADDHTIVRQGLASLLAASEECEVVAEAADGSEAVEKALATRPDVVVLDVSMPRLSGLEAARRISKAVPAARILALTMHAEPELVLGMVRAGVSGYLVKDGALPQLIDAIRALKAGRSYFGPHASKALAEANQERKAFPEDPYGRLTDREREVFQLVIEGKTNAQVADTLCISPKTVDNHRTHLMEKLGAHGAADLLRYAARRGLLR